MPMPVPQPKDGGIQGLLGGVHTDLLKLKEILGDSPRAQMLDGLIGAYQEFVKSLVGGKAPGPVAEEPPAPMGPVPMHQGLKGRPSPM